MNVLSLNSTSCAAQVYERKDTSYQISRRLSQVVRRGEGKIIYILSDRVAVVVCLQFFFLGKCSIGQAKGIHKVFIMA